LRRFTVAVGESIQGAIEGSAIPIQNAT
jgi:hypothetical protein